ncbi:hypothetical protein OSI46_25355, partial [Mycobacterium ulcerans]
GGQGGLAGSASASEETGYRIRGAGQSTLSTGPAVADQPSGGAAGAAAAAAAGELKVACSTNSAGAAGSTGPE